MNELSCLVFLRTDLSHGIILVAYLLLRETLLYSSNDHLECISLEELNIHKAFSMCDKERALKKMQRRLGMKGLSVYFSIASP